jgi:putative transposase
LTDEPIVRLILDSTVVRVRLDRKATAMSLLVVLGVRADGQKILLAIKSMGSESAEAWRVVIVDGAAGLDKAIAAVWTGVPVQRCTVHKLRKLLAHAPERLRREHNRSLCHRPPMLVAGDGIILSRPCVEVELTIGSN